MGTRRLNAMKLRRINANTTSLRSPVPAGLEQDISVNESSLMIRGIWLYSPHAFVQLRRFFSLVDISIFFMRQGHFEHLEAGT